MVAALVIPISGPYTGTWALNSLGTQNDDGFALTASYQGQEINQSDAYGMTLVEAIYRGINWSLRFHALEWNKPGLLWLMQMFGSDGSPLTTFTPYLTNIGDRWSKFCGPLTLTSILAATSAGGPTFISTLTSLLAGLKPGHSIESLFTSKMREAPIEMVLLPYQAVVASLTSNVAFTTT